jgi:hypothetical protein
MKKMIVFFAVLVIFSPLHAFIELNDVMPAFPEEAQIPIENNVIEGAFHFLQAQSEAALLLAEYEKSGRLAFNFAAALSHAGKAISEVEKSIAAYDRAISLGKESGYLDNVIQSFKDFNYDTVAAEKALNKDVMEVVKAYLSGGNILGVYQQNAEYLGEILLTLKVVADKCAIQQMPDVTLLWQLLQQFSRTALFGNYCTVTATVVFSQSE